MAKLLPGVHTVRLVCSPALRSVATAFHRSNHRVLGRVNINNDALPRHLVDEANYLSFIDTLQRQKQLDPTISSFLI